jgi:hypothetical protein
MSHNNGHEPNRHGTSLQADGMKDGDERGNLWSIVLAGRSICTMPFGVFQQLIKQSLTDLGVNRFLANWNTQLQKSPTVREGIPL